MSERRRVAVFNMDGATPNYLAPLLAANQMPNWKRLAESGSSGTIMSSLPVSDAAFVTLFTGLDYDQHGSVSAYEIDARKFPPVWNKLPGSQSFRDETIFSLASKAGLRVAGVNVCNMDPPWPVNGVLIPGTPVGSDVHPSTFPPDLSHKIAPMNVSNVTEVNVSRIRSCREYLDFNLARTLAVTKQLYASEPFDLFVAGFNTSELADHFFHANPALGETWTAVIEEYYRKLDVALGEFAAMLDPDTVLIVVSERGGGAFPSQLFRSNIWLEQLGLLARRKSAAGQSRALGALHTLYRTAMGMPFVRRLKRKLPDSWVGSGQALGSHWPFVDLSKTRAYAIEHFYPLAAFEVNLRGRQKHGIVAPGDEYERVRNEIIAALQNVRLPGSDRPLCRAIYRREELYTGPHAELLADVMAELDPDVKSDLVLGDQLFAPNPGETTFPYRGYHAQEGVLLMTGPGIRRGIDLTSSPLLDVAPTILHLLGLPAGEERRGNILAAVDAAPTGYAALLSDRELAVQPFNHD